ncbi:MAG: hypothetical protein K0Q72_3915, partial [Armatimonadetes bacterium]|nr:hypothetical protein [Armatimonadota bacterium]
MPERTAGGGALKKSICSIVCGAVLFGAVAVCVPPAAVAQQSAAQRRIDFKTLVNAADNATMVWVAPTTFTMGNGPDAHRVTLTKGYWLYQTPVTNAQYRKFLTATKHEPEPLYWTRPNFNGDTQPVVGVSHTDAVAYAK